MHDVAIVGYGPVGATLAGLLGRLGVDVVVVDKNPDIYPMPRAVGFDHDAMRIFQRVGICEAIRPFIEPFREEIYLGVDGQVLQHFKHMPKPYPLTWDPHFTCDQPAIERALRTQITDMPNVQVKLGYELHFFEQQPGAVTLHLKDTNDQFETLQARYLVGCDGASSFIRSHLNIDLENLDYDEPWLVVDMKVKDACLERLPSTNVQYCDPARPSTLICCPGNHRRWEFMTLPRDSSDAVIQEDQLWDLMSPWIKPGDADIWRAASYRFHALVARKWRAGRVFLAGDSAHQTPPFLGQGMCQGIRDAGNLAWKLHHVVSGFAPESLLATYEEERRPNVLATTLLAKECGLIISERYVEKAKIRDAEISEATAGLGRMIIRQDLIPPFATGFIDVAAPLAGTVFPQPLVCIADGEEALLDDLLSPRFHLILLAACHDDFELKELCNAARNLGVKIVVVHGTCLPGRNHHLGVLDVYETTPLIQKYLTSNDCSGAIVRPDLYVYCGIVNSKNALGALALLKNSLRALN